MKKKPNSLLIATLTSSILLLSACASTDIEQAIELPEPKSNLEITAPTPAIIPIEEEIQYGNFSEDILTRVILAELAGQRGLNQEALDEYQALARETGDIGIIKRSARIATFLRDIPTSIAMTEMWLVQEPDSIEAHQTISFQMISLGRYKKALEHFAVLLTLGADVDFRLITARATADENIALIIDALIADFNDLTELHPSNQPLLLGLAHLYQVNNQHQESYQIINLLAQQNNDEPELVILEIRLLELMGKTEQAQLRLKESLRTNPAHKQLRFLYARKLIDEQRYNDATEQLALIIKQDPEDFDILYSLSLLSMEMTRYNDAKGYLQRLVDNSQRLDDAHFYLAFINAQENNVDRAIEHYLQVNSGSNFQQAQRNVTALMLQQGRYPEASARLQNIRFRNPDYNLSLLTMEANLLIDANLNNIAVQFLNNAVGAFPNNLQLLFLRSVLSQNINDLALMEQDLRKIIRLNPDNAIAYNSLGYTLADRTERYDEAYRLIQQAMEIAPNDPAIIDSLGWVQYRLGRYEEAKESLLLAYELFPDHEVAAHLGEVLWVLGKKNQANRLWKKALEVQPDSKFILNAIERLSSDSSI